MKFGNLSLTLLLIAETTCRVQSSIPPPPPPTMGVRPNTNESLHQVKQHSSTRQPTNSFPPPPPPVRVETKDEGTTMSKSSRSAYTAPLVDEKEKVPTNEYLERRYNTAGAGIDDYSEEITTREQAEQFSKGFGTPRSMHHDSSAHVPPPPPGADTQQDRSNVIDFDDVTQDWNSAESKHKSLKQDAERPMPGPPNDENKKHEIFQSKPPSPQEETMRVEGTESSNRENIENEATRSEFIPGRDERKSQYSHQKQESQAQGWQQHEQKREPEWIVPKENQFQPQQQQERLHRPPPGPPPQGPDSYGHENLHRSRGLGASHPQQLQQGQGHMPRTYPQRPPPGQQPPQKIAPRNYNYSRGPPNPQQQQQQHHYQQQQQQQQFGPSPGAGALVPRRPQPPPGTSLLQRFGKSLDALADVDTLISQKAQQVMKTVSSGSGTVAESVSGAMRKTVFQGVDGVTGIKEGIKDTVRGRMSNIFGGAPTIATGTRDEWEDDRRKTVTEQRRKAILGTSGSDFGPGETFVGSGESPLQQHLHGLAQELDDTQKSDKIEVVHQPQQIHKDNDVGSGVERQGLVHGQVGDVDAYGSAMVDSEQMQPQQKKSAPEPVTNPYAMLAYPASKDFDEDDSSDYEDAVDPSTFFVTPPSSPPSSRSQSSASFDFEEDKISLSRKIGSLFKIPSPKLPFLNRRRGLSRIADSGWSDDDWGTPSTNTLKRTPAPSGRRPSRTKVANSNGQGSVEDLLMRHSTSSPVARKATANLLSVRDVHFLGRIGRSKAIMDILALGFVYVTVLECLNAFRGPFEMQSWSLPINIDDGRMFLQQITSTLSISDINLSDTWAPFAIIAAILSIFTRDVLFEPKAKELMNRISKTIKSSVLQSQLFLRLESGVLLRNELMQTFASASEDQGIATIEIARLRAFVFVTLLTVFATTVPVVKPICMNIFVALIEIVSYDGLREWPVDWDALGSTMKDLVIALVESLKVVFDNELDKIISNPMAIVSIISVAIALFIFSQLSVLERGRSTTSAAEGNKMPNIESIQGQELNSSERISSLGGSTVSRLELQMQEGAVEKILHQFQMEKELSRSPKTKSSANNLIIRKLAYSTICGVLTLAPIIAHIFISLMNEIIIDWGQFSGIILVLLFTKNIARTALFAAIDSTRNLPKVAPFLQVLSNTVKEVEATKRTKLASTRTSSSPSKGLVISDLWAANVAKRYVNLYM